MPICPEFSGRKKLMTHLWVVHTRTGFIPAEERFIESKITY